MTTNRITSLSLKISTSLFFISFFLFSCTPISEKEKEGNKKWEEMKTYFKERHHTNLEKGRWRKIVVLTGNGCLSCNLSLMQFVLNEAKEKRTLTLVTAPSTSLDLNLFKSMEETVFFDDDPDFERFPILLETKAILLKNNSIDSIITIHAENLLNQLNYIAAH